ncbi:SDR family NAD(P)-dependent oxidoreductase [Chloroflexota bacterium]
MGKLDNKIAIVTGGGTGIGQAIALEFAREGADIAVASRNMANLEEVEKEIKALGRRSLAIVTDVKMEEQVQQMAKRAADEFGRIDILVNNSGILLRAELLDMSEELWQDVLDTNLKSVFLCTQAVAPYMMERKYGKIINLGSCSGRGWNYPGMAIYSASKAAVHELTKCYARELGPYNINVNALAPGVIETAIFRGGRTPEQVEQVLAVHRKNAILGRLGQPEEVAKLAVFLASDDASYITGQTIPIDGGKTDRM